MHGESNMEQPRKGSTVLRDDGTRGTVGDSAEAGQLAVEFADGSRMVVSPQALIPQQDDSYRLAPDASDAAGARASREVVIPVIAEELTVETHQVERGRVRVRKRVETREEAVDAPTVREEVVVERIPVNRFVDDEAPGVRDEDGVLVVPVIEEVLVVEKRLMVREEVRVSKRRTTTSTPQTVVLRREVVDIEREAPDGTKVPESQPATARDTRDDMRRGERSR